MGYEEVFNELAKAGYETMFDDEWDKLPRKSIERALWLSVAEKMATKLWALYQGSVKEGISQG